MENFPVNSLNDVEAKIEDILLLYAADSMAFLDTAFQSNIKWSSTAIKAAYKLGRELGPYFPEASFGISFLDDAMKNGRRDIANLMTTRSKNNANIRYIAAS